MAGEQHRRADQDRRADQVSGQRADRRVRLTARVDGYVQGVGFRAWVRRRAVELRLAGSASNLADGGVEVVVEGDEENCRRLLAALQSGTTPGRVIEVQQRWSPAEGRLSGFVER